MLQTNGIQIKTAICVQQMSLLAVTKEFGGCAQKTIGMSGWQQFTVEHARRPESAQSVKIREFNKIENIQQMHKILGQDVVKAVQASRNL